MPHITQDILERFANLSKDYNPAHLDSAFAKDSYFGEGLNTLAEIQPKYCPSGDWLNLTTAVYQNRFVDGISPMN